VITGLRSSGSAAVSCGGTLSDVAGRLMFTAPETKGPATGVGLWAQVGQGFGKVVRCGVPAG
jgi:hypothetical protein